MDLREIQTILGNYKQELHTLIDKSEEKFEDRLTLISTGSLAISFLFIENVVEDFTKSSGRFFLLLGWLLLVICLLTNLLSHKIASKNHTQTLYEIDETLKLKDLNDWDDEKCYSSSRAENRRKGIGSFNMASICLLIGGIFFILVYASINIIQPQKEHSMSEDINKMPASALDLTKGLQGSAVPEISNPTNTSSDTFGIQGSITPQIPTPSSSKKD